MYFTPWAFCLPYQISEQQQNDILQAQLSDPANYSLSTATNRRYTPLWYSEANLADPFPKRLRYAYDDQKWSDRLALIALCKPLLEPFFLTVFAKITQVMLITYTDEFPGYFPHYDFRQHIHNNRPETTDVETINWMARIPLSADPDRESSNPPMYEIVNGYRHFISHENHYWMFKDEHFLHGVERRDYLRGLITIEGIVRPDIVENRDQLMRPFQLRRTNTVERPVELMEKYGLWPREDEYPHVSQMYQKMYGGAK